MIAQRNERCGDRDHLWRIWVWSDMVIGRAPQHCHQNCLRWAPTSYKWNYGLINGLFHHSKWSYGPLLITGMGPPCRCLQKPTHPATNGPATTAVVQLWLLHHMPIDMKSMNTNADGYKSINKMFWTHTQRYEIQSCQSKCCTCMM